MGLTLWAVITAVHRFSLTIKSSNTTVPQFEFTQDDPSYVVNKVFNFVDKSPIKNIRTGIFGPKLDKNILLVTTPIGIL